MLGFGVGHILTKKGSFAESVTDKGDIGYAYRAGLGVSYQFGEQVYFASGLRYASLSSRTKRSGDDLRFGTQWNGTVFNPTISSGENIDSWVLTARTSLLALPLELRYALRSAPNRFYLQGGVVPSLRLVTGTRSKVNGERSSFEKDNLGGLNDLWLAATLALGYECKGEGKVGAFAQVGPTLQLVQEAENSGSRRWDISALAGLRLQL